MREIARTLVDAGDGVPEGRLDFLVEDLRDFVSHFNVITRWVTRFAVIFVQLCPLLIIGRLSRFTKLDPEERLRCLETLENGPFGLSLVALKTFICLIYFEHPDALKETGFDGKALREQQLSLLEAPLSAGGRP